MIGFAIRGQGSRGSLGHDLDMKGVAESSPQRLSSSFCRQESPSLRLSLARYVCLWLAGEL